MSLPTAILTRQALAGANIVIEKVSRDSISLARVLAAAGAYVRLVDYSPRVASPNGHARSQPERHNTIEAYLAEPIPADHWQECAALAAQGVQIQIGWDWQADPFDFDILVADLYPPPTRPFIVEARRRGKRVSIGADLALQLRPLPAVGVTGTAGKSSTTALIASMLATAGQATYIGWDNVAQNPWINYEVLDRLDQMQPPGWIVAELTSSHLEYMQTSPDIAVVTNLAPDHVEWHGGLDAYYQAKAAILKHQTPDQWAILNYDDLARAVLAPHGRGHMAYFSVSQPVPQGVFLSGDQIIARWQDQEQVVASIQDAPVGRAYLGNVLAATAAALAAGAPPEAVRRALRSFRGLARRFERVGEVGGVAIVNDSMANTPHKAWASLAALEGAALVLIAGGHRRASWSDCLHDSPEARAQVQAACRRAAAQAGAVVLFGEAAPVLRQELQAAGMAPGCVVQVHSLDQALAAALGRAGAGATILLAPIFYMHPHESSRFDALVAEAGRRTAGAPSVH